MKTLFYIIAYTSVMLFLCVIFFFMNLLEKITGQRTTGIPVNEPEQNFTEREFDKTEFDIWMFNTLNRLK